ncbi:MAG TPA: apolipoprotein N-acyltransferase [Xanthobacteraceae bacterium]|nr:apolipoprotein N-acyltransferase [Xanthobacteraceae bacterium]
MLHRIANYVVLSWGWRRALIAFAMGIIANLALEPFSIWPVMFISFSVLVWLIDGASAGRWNGVITAGVTGWWFGFGYCLIGFYWIGHAFLVDAKTFAWLLPVAVVGLPAAMAIYMGLGVALARLLWTRGAWRIVTLAAALTASEWLRGHLFTGFPWNAFGYALTGPLPLAQGASLMGLWGMTFLAVAIFASPAVLADDKIDNAKRWLAPGWAALVLIALAGYGAYRLSQTPTAFVDGIRLRIVQPNLPQDDRFSYAAKASVMARYRALSDRATGPTTSGIADVTHLIWPESAFPFFLTREPDALADIANLLPAGTVLITGAVRAGEPDPDGLISRGYNSVYVIDHDGTILSVYDKVHLVPFGEYLPFQGFLESLGLQQLTKVRGGFIPGDRYRTQDIPGAPKFSPLVCYEIIFPGEGVPRGADRPDWLLNLTNDGWFGISTGPYQHLQQARVRAIEEGLPLVRAANSGISAVVDPLGRTLTSLPLATEGVLDAGLPSKAAPTLYSYTGDRHIALVLAVVLGISTIRRRKGL